MLLLAIFALEFGLISLGLVVLNGPGFRAALHWAGKQAAETYGWQADFQVKGTIWSGFSIENLTLDGAIPDSAHSAETPSLPASSIRISKLGVRYHMPGILLGATRLDWLRSVEVGPGEIHLILPESEKKSQAPESESKENSENSQSETKKEFAAFWNLLSADLQLVDLTLSVQQGNRVWSVDSLTLSLPSAGPGRLSSGRIALSDSQTLEGLNAVIETGSHSLSIADLALPRVGTMEALTVQESIPGRFGLTSRLMIAGGKIDLSGGTDTRGEIALTAALHPDTAISLVQLNDLVPNLKGQISDLKFSFTGDPAHPSNWQIDASLLGNGCGWGDYSTDSIRARVSADSARIEVKRGDAQAVIEALLPLSQASTTKEIATLPIKVGVKADVPSLTNLLNDLSIHQPVAGALTMEAQGIEILGGKLGNGTIQVTGNQIAWDGISLSEAQFSARVEREQFLKFAMDTALDDQSHLHCVGAIDLDEKSYIAELMGKFTPQGRLGEVLTTLRPGPYSGDAALEWKGSGHLKEKEHTGQALVKLHGIALAPIHPLTGEIRVEYQGKRVELTHCDLSAGGAQITGSGQWDGHELRLTDWTLQQEKKNRMTLELALPLSPSKDRPFLKQEGSVSAKIAFDEFSTETLRAFADEIPEVEGALNGELMAEGTFSAIQLRSHLAYQSPADQEKKTTSPEAKLSLSLTGAIERPASWNINLEAVVGALRWKETTLSNLNLKARTDTEAADRPLLSEVHFGQSGARLDATVRAALGQAETLPALAEVPIMGNLALGVENLATFLKEFDPGLFDRLPLSGGLSAKIDSLELLRGQPVAGNVTIHSPDLAFDGTGFSTIELSAEVTAPSQIDAAWNLALDATTQVKGEGSYHLKDRHYRGSLSAEADLTSKGSRLRKLLGSRRIVHLLPGESDLTWQGEGSLASASDSEEDPSPTHSGDLRLHARSLHLANDAAPLDIDMEGRYTATSADFPTLSLRSQPLNFEGNLHWQNSVLNFTGRGKSDGREVIALESAIPLDLAKLTAKDWFAQSDPLKVDLVIQKLAVDKLSHLFLSKPPIQGELSLDLSVGGAPASPDLNLKTRFDGILVPRPDQQSLPVGAAELSLVSKGANLALTGSYRHPDVQPLTFSSELPFHPGAWATGERQIADEKITASAKMERSSLAFLVDQVPGIESISGEIAIDASASGTVSSPHPMGSASLQVPRLRLENRNSPSLRDIDLLVQFRENQVILDHLKAIVAGGEVSGKGEILLKDQGEPELRFNLTGSDVLVTRTPDVNVRTDLDISLAGPLSQAMLSGELGIVNSRYFRNFDLLPMSLPTKRTTSALPTVQRAPSGGGPAMRDLDLGLKIDPFQNWPVALRVYTKDPFLIRSNLVESSIDADLHISGTLGNPIPVGQVEIEKGVMKLPFSKVDVETGRIEFDQTTGFNGAIEFKARAKADRYQIAIYLHDHILNPQYVLTSVPPLPSEDIMTLIATGTTRDALVGGDTESLAMGKAAGLLLKNLQQKSNKIDSDPTLLDLLDERTELELGRVNQETGEQTFGGKIRLWKQLFFAGDVSQQNDYRALLKYVFRFR